MSKNKNLQKAKKEKNDEFYTRTDDIQKEINHYISYDKNVFKGKTILLPCDDPEWSAFTMFFAANFQAFGIKKLISTSYTGVKNKLKNTNEKGRIYILEKDTNCDNHIDSKDIQWRYLEGDGDFRSEEVTNIAKEADIIITNPPFSLFREFVAWIMMLNKEFLILGNMNAITYKEVFPLIKENKIWLGCCNGAKEYQIPDYYPLIGSSFERNGKKYAKLGNTCWFTNIKHGKRYEFLDLDTMASNKEFNNKIRKNSNSYKSYDNYKAIEVPSTDGIPSDYDGVIGVPISFLDKYCPEQFEILGIDRYIKDNPIPNKRFTINDKEIYARILIRHR